jgi:hypothetical protein
LILADRLKAELAPSLPFSEIHIPMISGKDKVPVDEGLPREPGERLAEDLVGTSDAETYY